jgi:putative transposase
MERKVSFIEGEYYHLYNRGVDKRVIFPSSTDYRRFLMLLYLANSEEDTRVGNIPRATKYDDVFTIERGKPLVAIGAYCLMPNHFHLLITPLIENGISRFMLKLQTGYAMYFNKKNERNGSLFQGPFRSSYVDSDRYLQYLYSYIHLNPAKLVNTKWKDLVGSRNNLMKFVENYSYSSYKDYRSATHTITNPTVFPDYFSSKEEVLLHISDWLTNDDEYKK